MWISEPFNTVVAGRGWLMEVIRNNGECWGRLTAPCGTRLDVSGLRDVYDLPDYQAANYFARVARRCPEVRYHLRHRTGVVHDPKSGRA